MNLTVRSQHSAQLDATFKLHIHVDIVISDKQSNQPIAILDTKYKTDDQPSEEDIYQVSFYARELQVKHDLLVYPFMPTAPFRLVHAKDVRVEALAFDLGEPLEIAGPTFLTSLITRLPLQQP